MSGSGLPDGGIGFLGQGGTQRGEGLLALPSIGVERAALAERGSDCVDSRRWLHLVK